MHGDAMMRFPFRRVFACSALALGAGVVSACGEPLQARVFKAMDGCVIARNATFMRGSGDSAINIPLPAAVDSLAAATAYKYGTVAYQQISDGAQTQAELTCALELGSRYDSQETRDWLLYYSRHPNTPVATMAKRQLAKLRALKGERPVLEAPVAR